MLTRLGLDQTIAGILSFVIILMILVPLIGGVAEVPGRLRA